MMWSESAKRVFESEIHAAQLMEQSLDASFDAFCEAIDQCRGKVVMTGMGKSGHVCKKIVATMQSLGIQAVFLHPAEALHGDLGIVAQDDIVIGVSKSGESRELLELFHALRDYRTDLYCIVARKDSTLVKESKGVLLIPDSPEAFLGNIVPTASTTVTLILGDALAVAVAEKRGFSKNDFAVLHPQGLLGKRLTMRIRDIMLTDTENSVVPAGVTIERAVFEMCRKPIGGVNVVDEDGNLLGVFSDGDLRRLYRQHEGNMNALMIDSVMSRTPVTVQEDQMLAPAIDELVKMERMYSFYPVLSGRRLVGAVRLQDLSKSGLM